MEINVAEKKQPLWRWLLPRIVKAVVKVAIMLVVFIFLSNLLSPFSAFLGGFSMVIDVFFIVFIAFIILIELASGTIFQHLFGTARSLFVLFYLAHLFGAGVFSLAVEGVEVMVDLRIILATIILLSTLSLAKSMLNTVNFLSEKDEQAWARQQGLQVK